MKTFHIKISAHAHISRATERAATLRIVKSMLPSLEDQKWEQARRIIRKSPAPVAVVTKGPFSGLTRRELSMSGTCETDWY